MREATNPCLSHTLMSLPPFAPLKQPNKQINQSLKPQPFKTPNSLKEKLFLPFIQPSHSLPSGCHLNLSPPPPQTFIQGHSFLCSSIHSHSQLPEFSLLSVLEGTYCSNVPTDLLASNLSFKRPLPHLPLCTVPPEYSL